MIFSSARSLAGQGLSKFQMLPYKLVIWAQGVLPYQEVGGGGFDLTSSLQAKFGARSSHVHQIRGKTWEVLLLQEAKVGGKIPILGSNVKFRGQNLGYMSPLFLEAKFGAPTRISEANFGAKPLPISKYGSTPLGIWVYT